MLDHFGKAAAAASIALRVSSALALGTVSTTWLVAGLRTSIVSPLAAATGCPLMIINAIATIIRCAADNGCYVRRNTFDALARGRRRRADPYRPAARQQLQPRVHRRSRRHRRRDPLRRWHQGRGHGQRRAQVLLRRR